MVQDNRNPRAYELMTVLLPDMAEEETAATVERVLGYITEQNGQIKDNSTDSPWGRRRLAYTMRFQGTDYRDGYYVLTHFSATPEVIGEIERELKLNNQVIRYLLVMDDPKMGEHPKDENQDETGAEETPAAEEAPSTEEAPAEEQVAETAEQIEGEENPAPADAPVAEEAPVAEAAPAAKRSSKLPSEGEGTDWVAGDGTDTMPESFPLKGNTTSKIYHPKESPNYNNTTAEIYFATPEAAENHGYRLPKVLQNAGAAAAEPAADTEQAAAGATEEE